MSGYRYQPGHSRVPRLTGTIPLDRPTSTDNPNPTEDHMAPAKGPHRRHTHGVCPTCCTEFKVEDKRIAEVPCPECETLVPIARSEQIPPRSSG